MACLTSSAALVSISTALNRSSAVRVHRASILATPAARLVAFRPPPSSRSVSAKATYGNCLNPMTGSCGPSYNQRWRGSDQRSFMKWAEQTSNNLWFPVDVEETAQHYTFVADVPGLGKDEIKVQVNKDRELSISGERRQRSSTASSSNTREDGAVQGSESSKASASEVQRKRQERRFGTFRRSWNLPEDADVSQIRASVHQGVLTLVISRIPPVEPEVTEIPVN